MANAVPSTGSVPDPISSRRTRDKPFLLIKESKIFFILVRCPLKVDKFPSKEYQVVRTRETIRTHQTTTQQFFQPAGIMWAGFNKNYYVTTNENAEGTQRLVHSIVAPTLESTGVYTKIKELDYRGTRQTVWRVNADLYFKQLAQVKSWT